MLNTRVNRIIVITINFKLRNKQAVRKRERANADYSLKNLMQEKYRPKARGEVKIHSNLE